mmetsp:Transcript_41868/g.100737  ORF Transcript_41868/g.100737 Transcript_41868/m.100737 type:complete len:424 (+) Transcript_41868:691-1962(+)
MSAVRAGGVALCHAPLPLALAVADLSKCSCGFTCPEVPASIASACCSLESKCSSVSPALPECETASGPGAARTVVAAACCSGVSKCKWGFSSESTEWPWLGLDLAPPRPWCVVTLCRTMVVVCAEALSAARTSSDAFIENHWSGEIAIEDAGSGSSASCTCCTPCWNLGSFIHALRAGTAATTPSPHLHMLGGHVLSAQVAMHQSSVATETRLTQFFLVPTDGADLPTGLAASSASTSSARAASLVSASPETLVPLSADDAAFAALVIRTARACACITAAAAAAALASPSRFMSFELVATPGMVDSVIHFCCAARAAAASAVALEKASASASNLAPASALTLETSAPNRFCISHDDMFREATFAACALAISFATSSSCASCWPPAGSGPLRTASAIAATTVSAAISAAAEAAVVMSAAACAPT